MLNSESYKRQEITLILLNIGVVAALFVVHIVFLFEIGFPSKLLLSTLAVRFIILILELLWLQKLAVNVEEQTLRLHSHLSIWLNIVFAFVASIFGGTPDSHYSVLMIFPIIQAASHFNLAKTLGITAITIILTFLEVWIFFRQKPPIDYGEFFEAATVSLIFFVVGFIVWILVGYLRDEEIKLKQSLGELKETQAKLVAEEKLAAVGQLSSAIAHEIRNPLAMIASSLEMGLKQPENSALRAEMFEIVAQESSRLQVLTTDFLSYARPKEPEIKTHNVCDTLEYVSGLVKAKLAEKQIDLKVTCRTGLTAKFDASQIRQAMLNLVINAFDATLPNGLINMGGVDEIGNVRLFVENDGEAIPENVLPRIFEPFFTAKSKGTGLGLSIVHNIAVSHGGEIVLACNENGRVRFEIILPR